MHSKLIPEKIFYHIYKGILSKIENLHSYENFNQSNFLVIFLFAYNMLTI